jgi:hypothetical protein
MIQNRVVPKEEPPQLVGLSSLGQPPTTKSEPPAVVTESKPAPMERPPSPAATPASAARATAPAMPDKNSSDLLRNLIWMSLAGLATLAAATILVKAQTARTP